jgi:putative isomerase
LNFLDYETGGRIPVVIGPNNKDIMDTSTNFIPLLHNMHKPCLAQHAAFLVKLNGGDAEWLRDEFPRMQAFVDCYYNHYRDPATGLYYWQTDECIGVDNDPCTFFRPYASSGSILLNCFMYKELLAMVYLAGRLNMPEIGDSYQKWRTVCSSPSATIAGTPGTDFITAWTLTCGRSSSKPPPGNFTWASPEIGIA